MGKGWKASSDNEWTIKKKPKYDESTNVKCLIKEKAVKQIRTLVTNWDKLEWIAGLKGQITDEEIVIEELQLYEQEVQGAYCEFTDDGSVEMAQSDCIGWIHSHNSMGVFFSATDDSTCKFNKVSIVVNNKLEVVGKYRAKIMKNKDAYADLDLFMELPEEKLELKKLTEDLKVHIEKQYEKYNVNVKELELNITPEIDEEFLILAKDLITEKSFQSKISNYSSSLTNSIEGVNTFMWADLSQEEQDRYDKSECTHCDKPIKNSKLIVYDEMPYHKNCFQAWSESSTEEQEFDDGILYYDNEGFCIRCNCHMNYCNCSGIRYRSS